MTIADEIGLGAGWTVKFDRDTEPRAGAAASGEVDIKLVFDGGSKGNPGLGYGSFAYKGRVIRHPVRLTFPGRVTNNQAEYMTLIGGLQAALADLKATGQVVSELTLEVWSDSRLVVEQMNGRWKIKNKQLQRLHREAGNLAQRFKDIQFHWHGRQESVRILGH